MSNDMLLKFAKGGEAGISDILGDCKEDIDLALAAVKMVSELGHESLHPGQPDSPEPDTILAFCRLLSGHLDEAQQGIREAMKRLTEPEPPKEKATPKRHLKVQ